MKRFVIACLLLVAVGSLTGCSSIALKDLNADMPTVLVKKYQATKTPYADEGFQWLPLIFTSSGHVSVTKDGFHGERFNALGPLMLLSASNSYSDFDRDGRLLRRSWIDESVWGILFQNSASTNYLKEESSHRFRILFGILGYRESSNQAKTFYFLYIPIPISRGDDSQSGTETSSDKEADAASTGQDL